MNIVEIEDKEFNLPEGWNEVSVELFSEITKHSGFLSEYKSQTLFALEMLAILIGTEKETIMKLNKESFTTLAELCNWMNNDVKPTDKVEWEINGEIWVALTDFNKLTMGEAISLELILTDSKPEEVLINLLPLLIRKAKTVVKGGEKVLVPSDFNEEEYDENKEILKKEIMITDAIKLKGFF
jgi:hypothetical protein